MEHSTCSWSLFWFSNWIVMAPRNGRHFNLSSCSPLMKHMDMSACDWVYQTLWIPLWCTFRIFLALCRMVDWTTIRHLILMVFDHGELTSGVDETRNWWEYIVYTSKYSVTNILWTKALKDVRMMDFYAILYNYITYYLFVIFESNILCKA